jgi:hypothetical protein
MTDVFKITDEEFHSHEELFSYITQRRFLVVLPKPYDCFIGIKGYVLSETFQAYEEICRQNGWVSAARLTRKERCRNSLCNKPTTHVRNSP